MPMPSPSGLRNVALAALLAFAPAVFAWEAGSDGLKPIPALSARVTDLASALSAPERSALEAKLAAFESSTGAQLAVLVVPSTQPEPIEAYALRVADAWKIGRKGNDNGVLFVVAKDDRRMRLEVGYGLEGAIPDAIARRIIAEDVAPKFRENRYAAGIEAGVDRIVGIVSKGETLPPPTAAKGRKGSALGNFDPVLLIVLLFVVIPAVGAVLKSVFGKLLGSAVGGGVVGAGAFVLGGSLLLAGLVAFVAFVVILVMGAAGLASAGRRGGGGVVIPGGGWGGGGGFGGGGGWSGGGGGFGGGGASGSW